MKKLIAIAALATAAIATPAFAGTLTGEVRFADVNGTNDSTEIKAEYWDTLVGNFVAGAEIQAKQAAHAGAVDATFSGKIGYNLPAVLGVSTVAYGEFGEAFKAGPGAGEFWGAGVKASREVYGPVSLNVGYRHRQGLKANDGLNEERLNAGLGYALSDRTSVGATYYRTRGTTDSDAIGVSVSQKF